MKLIATILHTSATLLALGLATVAHAQSEPVSLRFDSGSFNWYTNRTNRAGYVSLGYHGGEFVVTLSASPGATVLPRVRLEDRQGNADRLARNADTRTLADSYRNIALDYRGDAIKTITLFHDEVERTVEGARVHVEPTLEGVIARYDKALSELGFRGTLEYDASNLREYRYSNGEREVHVTFVRGVDSEGREIRVTLSSQPLAYGPNG